MPPPSLRPKPAGFDSGWVLDGVDILSLGRDMGDRLRGDPDCRRAIYEIACWPVLQRPKRNRGEGVTYIRLIMAILSFQTIC